MISVSFHQIVLVFFKSIHYIQSVYLGTLELAVNLLWSRELRKNQSADFLLRRLPPIWASIETRSTMWIDRRQMPAHKLGKLWKFKATEVDEWIRQGKAGEDKEDGSTTSQGRTTAL